jgi:hypothetical protein
MWNKGNQDGGPNKFGTVLGFRKKDMTIVGDYPANLPPLCAVVKWDESKKYFYPIGNKGEFLIALANTRHGAITGQKVTLDNILLGATVERGADWTHDDQDGGKHSRGTILGWCRADGTEEGDYGGGRYKLACRVRWTNTGSNNFYRIGKGGLYDLVFSDVSRGVVARRRWKKAQNAVFAMICFKHAGRDHTLLFAPPLAPGRPDGRGLDAMTLELQWKVPITRQDVQVYEVQFGFCYVGQWTTAASSITKNEYRLRGLKPDTSYVIRVRARNINGWSEWSRSSPHLMTLPEGIFAPPGGGVGGVENGGGMGMPPQAIYLPSSMPGKGKGGAVDPSLPPQMQMQMRMRMQQMQQQQQMGKGGGGPHQLMAGGMSPHALITPQRRQLMEAMQLVEERHGDGGVDLLVDSAQQCVGWLDQFKSIAATASNPTAQPGGAAAGAAGAVVGAAGGPGAVSSSLLCAPNGGPAVALLHYTAPGRNRGPIPSAASAEMAAAADAASANGKGGGRRRSTTAEGFNYCLRECGRDEAFHVYRKLNDTEYKLIRYYCDGEAAASALRASLQLWQQLTNGATLGASGAAVPGGAGAPNGSTSQALIRCLEVHDASDLGAGRAIVCALIESSEQSGPMPGGGGGMGMGAAAAGGAGAGSAGGFFRHGGNAHGRAAVTLRARLEQGPLCESELWAVFERVVEGLAELHDSSTVHRRIAPDQVLMCTAVGKARSGGGGGGGSSGAVGGGGIGASNSSGLHTNAVKIGGLEGCVKVWQVGSEDDPLVMCPFLRPGYGGSSTGGSGGGGGGSGSGSVPSVPFPPECAEGEAHGTAAYTLRSDVWQLGALLYTMSTGRGFGRSGRQLNYLKQPFSVAGGGSGGGITAKKGFYVDAADDSDDDDGDGGTGATDAETAELLESLSMGAGGSALSSVGQSGGIEAGREAFGVSANYSVNVLKLLHHLLQEEQDQRPTIQELAGLVKACKADARIETRARAHKFVDVEEVQDQRGHLRQIRREIDAASNKGAGGGALADGGAAAGKKAGGAVDDTLVVFSLCPPGVALRTSLFVRRWLLVQVSSCSQPYPPSSRFSF